MTRKFKVAVGMSCWDDPKGLLKAFEQKHYFECIDTTFVIDGRYEGRVDEPDNHKDIILAICSKYNVYYTKMYNCKQIDKRNKYLNLAEEGGFDFLLAMDSDEWLEFPEGVENFYTSLLECWNFDSYCFPIQTSQMEITITPRPRLFKAPFTYRHKVHKGPNISHGSLWSEHGKGNLELIQQMYRWTAMNRRNEGIPGVMMYHDKSYRTPERVKADGLYFCNNPNR